MKLDLTPFENAVAQMKEALDVYDSKLIQTDPQLKKHMRSAVIQAFEYTYELSFKMIKRYLAMSSANPGMVTDMNFNEIIREAYAHNILKSDLVSWKEYRERRATTSYTYDEEKAQIVFESASKFLEEAQYVLSQLQVKGESL